MKSWLSSSLLALAVALTAAACLKENPGYCPQIVHEDKCVECVTSSDCTTADKPACGADFTCRACRLDTECDSGACGDDGRCLSEAELVYMAPDGLNVPPCTRDAPCSDLEFAARQTTETRKHVTMAPGKYMKTGVFVSISETTASRVYIHGRGSQLGEGGCGEGMLTSSQIPLTVRDLYIECLVTGTALNVPTGSVIERVRIQAYERGIGASGFVTIRDLRLEGAGIQVFNGALELDRATLIGAGISGNGTISISNLVAYSDPFTQVLDLSRFVGGTISFSTIVSLDSGATAPKAILCPAGGFVISSSIVWSPDNFAVAPANDTCFFQSSIVGPVGVPGQSSDDPRFLGLADNDYHLSSSSPARDLVDRGPALDFEGDLRPGPLFDIGADESL